MVICVRFDCDTDRGVEFVLEGAKGLNQPFPIGNRQARLTGRAAATHSTVDCDCHLYGTLLHLEPSYATTLKGHGHETQNS